MYAKTTQIPRNFRW